eukprot:6474362-Amphidinium_carterae.1
MESMRHDVAWTVIPTMSEYETGILFRTAQLQLITSCDHTWEGIAHVQAARFLIRGAAYNAVGVAVVKFLARYDERRLSTQTMIGQVMTWLQTHSVHIAYVAPGRLTQTWRTLAPVLPRMLDKAQCRQSASADFFFGKVLPPQGDLAYGMLAATDLPHGFAFKAHGSFGAAPDDAEGETPFPISFLRLRYLPVPSGYRKRSAQALERRAMRKIQRHQAAPVEAERMDLLHAEAAGAAATVSTTSTHESEILATSMCEHVDHPSNAESAWDCYIAGVMSGYYYTLSMMPLHIVFRDDYYQVHALPMHRPIQAARAANACLCMWYAGLTYTQHHMCQAYTQAASAVFLFYSSEQHGTCSGALANMHPFAYMPFCSQCDLLVLEVSIQSNCSVAILTQRNLLELYDLPQTAEAAFTAILSVDRGLSLLLLQAASAASVLPFQAASAASGMAVAGFAQYVTAGLHVTSGGLLNLETRRGFIARLFDEYWTIKFSLRTDIEHDIVGTLDAVNVISTVSTCVDCRPLKDPRCFGHIGRHPDIVEGIGRHRQIAEVMTEAILSLQRLYQLAIDERVHDEPISDPKLRTVLFLCKSGKHRSVCLAEFVSWQLGVEVTHLSVNFWPRQCAGRCPHCARSYVNQQHLTRLYCMHHFGSASPENWEDLAWSRLDS